MMQAKDGTTSTASLEARHCQQTRKNDYPNRQMQSPSHTSIMTTVCLAHACPIMLDLVAANSHLSFNDSTCSSSSSFASLKYSSPSLSSSGKGTQLFVSAPYDLGRRYSGAHSAPECQLRRDVWRFWVVCRVARKGRVMASQMKEGQHGLACRKCDLIEFAAV